MTGLGDRLRRALAFWCPPAMMRRVVEPTLADVGVEYEEARRAGRVWRSRLVIVGGGVALIRALALAGLLSVTGRAASAPSSDRATLRTTMLMAVVAMVLVAAAFSYPIWDRLAGNSRYGFAALYLVPQLLPIALPVGLAVGILAGTTRGKSSPWIRARLLAVALVCSAASFAITGWVVPEANQEFRLTVLERSTGERGELLRGTAELTFDELFRGARAEAALTNHSRQARAAFYVRIALPLAPVALAIVALVATGRSHRLRLHALAGGASVLGYYALMVGFEPFIKAGAVGPIAAGLAVPLLLVSALLLILRRTSPVT